MIPYSKGIMLDSTNNYGIVKTETLFGFQQRPNDLLNGNYNLSEPFRWVLTPVTVDKRSLGVKQPKIKSQKSDKRSSKKLKKNSKRTGRKKCVVQMKDKRGRRRRRTKGKMGKKLVLPIMLGLMAAKSLLVPIVLKALAYLAAKGFLMGFFSTILASFLSLKGLFEHTQRYQDRKDEKTQVEIVQVPAPAVKEEHYYDDPYYRREDFMPLVDKAMLGEKLPFLNR